MQCYPHFAMAVSFKANTTHIFFSKCSLTKVTNVFYLAVLCYLTVHTCKPNSSDDSTVSPASCMVRYTNRTKNSTEKQELFNLTSAVSHNPLFLSFSFHFLLYSGCHGLSMCILCFRGIFPVSPPTPHLWPENGPYLDHNFLCFSLLKQQLLCHQFLADKCAQQIILSNLTCGFLGMRKSNESYLLMMDETGLVLADPKARLQSY